MAAHSSNQQTNLHPLHERVLEAVLGHGAQEGNENSVPLSSTPENTRLDQGHGHGVVAKEPDADECDEFFFAVGDHVYQWCSLAGIPGMFQHHGIVVQSMDGQLTIADFNGMISQSSNNSVDHDAENGGETTEPIPAAPKKSLFSHSVSAMREHTIDESKEGTTWKKVKYNAGWIRRSFSRSGTCTSAQSDPPGLVLARVQFLLDNAHLLPPYHVFKANCECVAVWCKTGTWATLQASSFLEITAAGQVKSATTLALYASGQTVSVPAAGVWGWLGYTTKVSLLSTQPLLLPALAGYGIVSVGGPMWMLHRSKASWHETTTKLNDQFWANALERPDVFVECITHWSGM